MDASTIKAIESLLYLCTFLTTVSAGLNVLMAWYNKARAPAKKQNERLTVLEEDVKNLKIRIESNDKRIHEVESYASKNEDVIESIKDSVEKLNANLEQNEKRMVRLSNGEKVTQRAILALISYELNEGDGHVSLTEARDKLNEYLLEK